MKTKFLKIIIPCFTLIILLLLILLGFKYDIFSTFSKDNTIPVVSDTENNTNTSSVQTQFKEPVCINMAVIGDIMCHNTQYKDAYNSKTGSYDFSYVFSDIKDYISSADISIGNLETTFAGKEKDYSSYPRFNTPEQLAENLKDLGIDVLSTANNHSLDSNYSGLVSTLNFLDNLEISHTGTYSSPEAQNDILIKNVSGIKIAFLSFTYGTNGIPVPEEKDYCINLIDEDLILKQISLAKEQNPDLICVNVHWGTEYQTKQNSSQEKLADLLFENGVDIILGSHPHVLQPMEKRVVTLPDGSTKNCFVVFSLGNFISGQTKTNTRNSVILNIGLKKDMNSGETTISSVDYVPIYMYKSSASSQRYRVLDIEKSIKNYEKGIDSSIGSSTYSTLVKELKKIRNTMGDKIIF